MKEHLRVLGAVLGFVLLLAEPTQPIGYLIYPIAALLILPYARNEART